VKGIATTLDGPFYPGSSQLTTALSAAAIILFAAVEGMQARGWAPLYGFAAGRTWPLPLRWAAYAVLVFGVSILGVSSHEFIYLQF